MWILIRAFFRLLWVIGLITFVAPLLYWMFTGEHYLYITDDIDELGW